MIVSRGNTPNSVKSPTETGASTCFALLFCLRYRDDLRSAKTLPVSTIASPIFRRFDCRSDYDTDTECSCNELRGYGAKRLVAACAGTRKEYNDGPLFVHEGGQEASAPHSVGIYSHASCFHDVDISHRLSLFRQGEDVWYAFFRFHRRHTRTVGYATNAR